MENSKNCQKRLLENSLKNSVLRVSIDWEFLSINQMFLFNWPKRNWEPIDLGRNSMMKFSIVSIDIEFLSINQML